MAAEKSLNLALRITADMAEAKQGLEALAGEVKTVGAHAEASNQQWKSAADAQQAASEAARQHAQSQQGLDTALNTSAVQSQRAARSSEEVTAAWQAQSARGHALYQEEQKVAQAEEAATKAAEAHAKEVDKLKKDLDSLLGSIDPVTRAFAKLDAQEEKLRKSYKSGLIDTGSFDDYLAKIQAQRDALGEMSDNPSANAPGMTGALRELSELIREITSGDWQSTLDGFEYIGSRLSALPALITPVRLGLGLTAGAVIGVAAAIYSIMEDQDRFNASIQQTGNYAGVTAGQLEMMAQAGGDMTGNYSQVRDILNGLVSSGKFTGETLESVAQAASVMAELTGQSADQVVSEFVKMTDSVSDWARNSSEQYHWLDAETYQRIRSLEEQGRTEDAIELASQKYKKAATERLVEIEEKLNWVAKGWKDITDYMGKAIQVAMGGTSTILGLDSESEARLKKISDLKERLSRADRDPFTNLWGNAHHNKLQQMRAELVQLEAAEAASKAAAKEETRRQKVERDAIAASKELEKIRFSNLSELDKEAEGLDKLKKKYQEMWASEGAREGIDGLRDRGVKSDDGINFSGGQWDIDVKALDKTGQKAKQYNEQLQRQLDLKTANTNAAKIEYEIEHGLLKNATEEAQSDARVRAELLDEEEARQKALKASAASSKQSFAENQRFVDQLVKQATRRTEGAAALRAEEIATRNLTDAQRQSAEAANAAINAREFGTQNTQLQVQYMKDMGDAAGASLLEVRNKYAEMREEMDASGNTEGVAWIDKLLPVAETKIRVDDLKKQLDDLFTYQSQQESSIQAQVQGGLLSEIQGRQRLIELHGEVGDKIKALLPDLKKMADLPGEAGEKIREMIRQLEDQLGKLSQAGNELTVAFRDGLQSGIESSLLGLAKGTMNLGDAVRNLALSIVDSMAKIAAQQLAQMATNSLTGTSGAMGGILGSLGSLFASTGGHVQGPGTATSDSIPAWLSDDEFVTRAAVVQQPGALDFLHAFNRNGMAALEGWLPRARHATGGLAGIPAPRVADPAPLPDTALSNAAGTVAPVINLQQVLALNAAEVFTKGAFSVEGERAIMTTISANLPTVKQMMGVK